MLLVYALESPGGGLREMRQRGAVVAGLLNPVLRHGSRAQWQPKAAKAQTVESMDLLANFFKAGSQQWERHLLSSEF